MKKEQIKFLLNFDRDVWGAFSGKNFDKFSKVCEDVLKGLPMDIWDNNEVTKWKDNEQRLRKSIEDCLESKFEVQRDLRRHLGKFLI